MSTDLPQIEAVFHRALEFGAAERAGYLDDVAAENPSLRREVDSLIAAYESSPRMLEENAVTLGMKVLSAEATDSIVGKDIGSYKVLSLIGQGGMGAVYLAEHRLLNKKVALKFLAAEYRTDNWARRQLIKEAQAVAVVDHPNVCAVYDLEEVDERCFIVMQYIEGQTLADLIRQGSLEPSQIVSLAQQIASALAAAHAHNIVHRDIKPRNIMVTPDGQVKILDFGLAKTTEAVLSEETESISQLSNKGVLVGTIAYMSPEQLRAERVDYRSDIFSLGTVFYEMVWGQNPFAHKNGPKNRSNAEVITAIMDHDSMPLRKVSTNCPRGFDRIVHKCLRKNPTERYQSVAQLLVDLDHVQKKVASLRRLGSGFNARAAAIAVGLLLALFAMGAVYTTWDNQSGVHDALFSSRGARLPR